MNKVVSYNKKNCLFQICSMISFFFFFWNFVTGCEDRHVFDLAKEVKGILSRENLTS